MLWFIDEKMLLKQLNMKQNNIEVAVLVFSLVCEEICWLVKVWLKLMKKQLEMAESSMLFYLLINFEM